MKVEMGRKKAFRLWVPFGVGWGGKRRCRAVTQHAGGAAEGLRAGGSSWRAAPTWRDTECHCGAGGGDASPDAVPASGSCCCYGNNCDCHHNSRSNYPIFPSWWLHVLSLRLFVHPGFCPVIISMGTTVSIGTSPKLCPLCSPHWPSASLALWHGDAELWLAGSHRTESSEHRAISTGLRSASILRAPERRHRIPRVPTSCHALSPAHATWPTRSRDAQSRGMLSPIPAGLPAKSLLLVGEAEPGGALMCHSTGCHSCWAQRDGTGRQLHRHSTALPCSHPHVTQRRWTGGQGEPGGGGCRAAAWLEPCEINWVNWEEAGAPAGPVCWCGVSMGMEALRGHSEMLRGCS